MSKLGSTIRKLRETYGLTQLQLGEKIGLAESTISLYESGKREPDISTLEFIADFFKVTVDYLLGKSDSRYSQELVIPEELKGVQVAFHRGEFAGLTQDEVDALAVIAKTLKAQRKGVKKDGQT